MNARKVIIYFTFLLIFMSCDDQSKIHSETNENGFHEIGSGSGYFSTDFINISIESTSTGFLVKTYGKFIELDYNLIVTKTTSFTSDDVVKVDSGFLLTNYSGHTNILALLNNAFDTVWTSHETHEGALGYNGILVRAGGGFVAWESGFNSYLDFFSFDGHLQKSHYFRSPNVDFKSFDITGTQDGGYALCGLVGPYDSDPHHEFYAVKVDLQGDSTRSFRYDRPSFQDDLYGIEEVPQGGFVSVGKSVLSSLRSDAFVARLTANGDSLWTYLLPSDSTDLRANDVQITAQGDFIIVGSSSYDSADCHDCNGSQLLLAKISQSGSLVWKKILSTRSFIGEGICKSGNDFVVVCLELADDSSTNIVVVRIDADGNIIQ